MTADTVGGVWTYAMDLVRGLNRHDVHVTLATMGAALSPEQAREAASLPNLNVHASTYRLEWMPGAWADVQRAGDWLLALENDLDPDIVHLNGYAHGSLPWRAPTVVVGHSCVLSWWRAVRGEAAPEQWSDYKSAVTRGIRAACLVVVPTHAMLAELRRDYGPLPESTVIPNGRSAHIYYEAASKDPLILAAGRLWDEAKNIESLANLCRRVDWPVAVAGDTSHPDGRTADLPNLQLLGRLTPVELASWYSRAAIYCLPARYEPFGLSVLEAALSGCALVLGDIPSLRENWDGAARFAAPDDHRAIEDHLNDLIAHRPHRLELAKLARSRAQSFTIERMADAYLTVYHLARTKALHLAAAGD